MRDFGRVKAALAASNPRASGPEFWERALRRARVEQPAASRRAALNSLLRWQRGAAWVTAAAAAALLLAVPLRLPGWQQDRAGDARHVIAWHAGYCSRQSLADRAPMQLIATRAHLSGSR
jgi:hypothetical protein